MPVGDAAVLTRNRLLATLAEGDLENLTATFEERTYGAGDALHDAGAVVREVVFPTDSVFSVVAETAEGHQVEAGTVGNEGAVGLPPFLEAESSLLRTMCQIPGRALVASAGDLLALGDGAITKAVRRYALAFMTMASQGAACNRVHGIEQRAARWLLMVSDRIDRSPFELTHEFFAVMLGTTRPSVSLAAATLKRAGLITYQRGRVTIIDRRGLEDVSCECYEIITTEYERATGARLRPGIADLRP